MTHGRFIELDLLRTFAIAMMVVYHTAFDLSYFFGQEIDLRNPAWEQLRIGTFGLFLLLVGCSFVVSTERHVRGETGTSPRKAVWRRALRRSAVVLGCAMLVTGATYLVSPVAYVRFGILHMIGISILLMPLFRRLREGNLLIGTFLLSLKHVVETKTAATSLLLPFGVRPPGFQTLDYYPLIPWFGIILVGMGIGHFLYVRFPAWRAVLPTSPMPAFTALALPGRHALLIYMVHQPVLLGTLYLLFERSGA